MTLGLAATPSQTWGKRNASFLKGSKVFNKAELADPVSEHRSSATSWSPEPFGAARQNLSKLQDLRPTVNTCENKCQETYLVGVAVPPSEQSWIALKASRFSSFGDHLTCPRKTWRDLNFLTSTIQQTKHLTGLLGLCENPPRIPHLS